jgi:gas vesicle protein
MYDYRRGGGVLFAFLLGGVIGAVLGLLFSPRSGKENRELIADTANKYWNEGVELYGQGVDRVSEMYSTGVDAAGNKSAELREKIDAARDRLQDQVAESVPAAKEKVSKASAATKKGVDVAEDKAQQTLDTVAEKSTRKKKSDKPEETPAEDAPADAAVPEV